MSPDGKWIAYAAPGHSDGDVFVMRADGAKHRRLTSTPEFEGTPIYSPDGTTIAFERLTDGLLQVWLMDTDGQNQRQLTFTQGNVESRVWRFSPDGNWLLVHRVELAGPLDMANHVIGPVLVPVGDNQRPLIDLNGAEVGFAPFSPDGKWIVYSAGPSLDEVSVRLMNLEDSTRRRVGLGAVPSFTPDGQTILFLENMLALTAPFEGSTWWAMDVAGGDRRRVGAAFSPLCSPDGRHLVYTRFDMTHRMFRRGMDGGPPVEIDAPAGYKPGLRPCKGGLVFSVGQSAFPAGGVCFLDTSNWTVTQIVPRTKAVPVQPK